MAFSDGSSVPLAVHTESASPHEVTLVEATLASSFLKEKPKRLLRDKDYDSDLLDEALLEQGIEMIAAHRKNRKTKKTQGANSGAADEVENRAALRLASEFQASDGSLRIQAQKLPGHGAARVHRYPAKKVLMK